MIITFCNTVNILSTSSDLNSPVLKPNCYFYCNYSIKNFFTSVGYSYANAVVKSSNNSIILCYLMYKSAFSTL